LGYEKTILSEATDPNLLYDLERQLFDFHIFDDNNIKEFAKVYFNPKSTQGQLYGLLSPFVDRYRQLEKDERIE